MPSVDFVKDISMVFMIKITRLHGTEYSPSVNV